MARSSHKYANLAALVRIILEDKNFLTTKHHFDKSESSDKAS